MIALPLAPLWLLEIFASALVIVFSILSLRLSKRLVRRDPENALWLFLNWLCIAFFIFSILHLVAHVLLEVRRLLEPPQYGALAARLRRV